MSSTFHGITPGVAFGKPGPFAALVAAGSSLLTGLVSWWDLDEESGVRVDSVGSNDLTDNNTVGYAAGKIGNAADIVQANNEYFNNATFPTTADYTISTWVYANAGLANCDLLSAIDTWPNQAWSAVYLSGGTWYQLVGNGSAYVFVANGAISTETWLHIVTWYDSSTNKASLSINGSIATTGALSGTLYDSSGAINLRLGFGGGVGASWDGLMDLTGVWNRVLTSDERTELYNAGAGKDYPF